MPLCLFYGSVGRVTHATSFAHCCWHRACRSCVVWHHLTTAAAAIRVSFYISASAAGGVDISARAEAIDVRAADNR